MNKINSVFKRKGIVKIKTVLVVILFIFLVIFLAFVVLKPKNIEKTETNENRLMPLIEKKEECIKNRILRLNETNELNGVFKVLNLTEYNQIDFCNINNLGNGREYLLGIARHEIFRVENANGERFLIPILSKNQITK